MSSMHARNRAGPYAHQTKHSVHGARAARLQLGPWPAAAPPQCTRRRRSFVSPPGAGRRGLRRVRPVSDTTPNTLVRDHTWVDTAAARRRRAGARTSGILQPLLHTPPGIQNLRLPSDISCRHTPHGGPVAPCTPRGRPGRRDATRIRRLRARSTLRERAASTGGAGSGEVSAPVALSFRRRPRPRAGAQCVRFAIRLPASPAAPPAVRFPGGPAPRSGRLLSEVLLLAQMAEWHKEVAKNSTPDSKFLGAARGFVW